MEDARRIALLHIVSWQATYAAELPAEFLAGQRLSEREADWRVRLERGVAAVIAEEEGDLVGFVACGPVTDAAAGEKDRWEIYNLHVARSWQGRGVGIALFERAADLGREHGAAKLVLWVVRTNDSARAFYEHRGMTLAGAAQDRDFGSGDRLRVVRYEMNLEASGR